MQRYLALLVVLCALGSPEAWCADDGGLGAVYPVDSYGANPDDGIDDSVAIQAAINAAHAGGGGTVTFSAGVYDVGMNPVAHVVFSLTLLSDVTLQGSTSGTTELLHHSQDVGYFELSWSSDIQFHDLVLDYAPDAINFTQGTVASAADAQGNFEVDIELGYRDPTALSPSNYQGAYYSVYLWEPGTLFQKADHWFLECETNVVPLGNRRWRCKLTSASMSRASEIAVGDRVTLDGRTNAFTFLGGQASGLVVEDVTLYHNPGVSVANLQEYHGSTFRRFQVLRRPGTTRILTANGDVLHLTSCGNLTVDQCVFEGLGDDAIAHAAGGSFVTEVNATGDEIWVRASTFGLLNSVGHRLQIFDYTTGEMRQTATGEAPIVAGVQGTRNGNEVNLLLQAPVVGIVADPNGTMGVADSLFDVDDAKGYSITNCEFVAMRGIAIRARLHDGIVSGNFVRHTNGEGCLIANDVVWGSGPIPENVTLTNNVFLDCNRRSAGTAQIWIGCRTLTSLTAFADRAAKNITLLGNYCIDSPDRAIVIQSTENLLLDSMGISHSFHSVSSLDYRGVVIRNSDQIKYASGFVTDMDPAVGSGVWIQSDCGPDVTVDDGVFITVPATATPVQDDRSDG